MSSITETIVNIEGTLKIKDLDPIVKGKLQRKLKKLTDDKGYQERMTMIKK